MARPPQHLLLHQSMSTVSSRQAAAWPVIAPPIAPREDRQIHQLGRVRVDAYAWMKFIPPVGTRTLDTLPPRLRQHLQAEMEYAQSVLQPLRADAAELYQRMASRAAGSSAPGPASVDGWQYGSELPVGRAF